MSTKGGGPTCPKPARLRELIEIVGELEFVDNKVEYDLIDALDWLATMLENRSLYHRRQQIKNKIVRQLAHEHGLDSEVDVLTKHVLFDFVSEQPPQDDEIEIEFPETPGDNNV